LVEKEHFWALASGKKWLGLGFVNIVDIIGRQATGGESYKNKNHQQ